MNEKVYIGNTRQEEENKNQKKPLSPFDSINSKYNSFFLSTINFSLKFLDNY